MTDFEKQVWAAVYAAEYVRFRGISEQLHSQNPTSYVSPEQSCADYTAATVAMEAVKKMRELKNSEDAPYLFLEKLDLEK